MECANHAPAMYRRTWPDDDSFQSRTRSVPPVSAATTGLLMIPQGHMLYVRLGQINHWGGAQKSELLGESYHEAAGVPCYSTNRRIPDGGANPSQRHVSSGRNRWMRLLSFQQDRIGSHPFNAPLLTTPFGFPFVVAVETNAIEDAPGISDRARKLRTNYILYCVFFASVLRDIEGNVS